MSSFSTSVLHVATQTVGVHQGERDHPGGLLQSPCSAPAQPCHHCSHGFPQQGGGAPVPEQGLFCSQNLYGGRRVLGQVCEAAGVRDQTSSNLKLKKKEICVTDHTLRVNPIKMNVKGTVKDHQHRIVCQHSDSVD